MKENGKFNVEELSSDPAAVAHLLHLIISGGNGKQVKKALVVNHKTPPTISIPESMNKLEASEELRRQHEEEETLIDVNRRFEGWKWQDVLVAVKLTAEEYFGWINAQQSFMNPPTEIEVVVDYQNGLPIKTTCFYGKFKATALEEAVCSIGISRGEVVISFNIKKKFKERITDWYNLIDKHLREKSIYRGKSVSVTAQGDQFGDDVTFEIIETKSNPNIVLNPKELSVLENYCALDLLEEGKRTYLFTGPYGNGKTEGAMMLGDKAKALGMTFFYVKDSDAFIPMLSIAAKFYSPCFIFMEDIDEVGSGEERTQEINELLNTLDGAETKNKSIKVLFTTNHHETINPALRRPGRLDLIVRFENPQKQTVANIYRKYFDTVDGNETIDYEEIAQFTPECSGAFIAEICKRSLRLAKLNNGLTNDIVRTAIHTIDDHLKLMSDPLQKKSPIEFHITEVAKYIAKFVQPVDTESLVESIDNASNNISSQVANEGYGIKRVVEGAAEDLMRETKKVKKDTGTIVSKLS